MAVVSTQIVNLPRVTRRMVILAMIPRFLAPYITWSKQRQTFVEFPQSNVARHQHLKLDERRNTDHGEANTGKILRELENVDESRDYSKSYADILEVIEIIKTMRLSQKDCGKCTKRNMLYMDDFSEINFIDVPSISSKYS
ncbi:hypothetical protein BDQ17DRAFT_526888 [Cyathus striatus]|nr:hypothetical protein BDQ17DRAFT_526888 [Cyathus striatus]